jgi:hypothetical protein
MPHSGTADGSSIVKIDGFVERQDTIINAATKKIIVTFSGKSDFTRTR